MFLKSGLRTSNYTDHTSSTYSLPRTNRTSLHSHNHSSPSNREYPPLLSCTSTAISFPEGHADNDPCTPLLSKGCLQRRSFQRSPSFRSPQQLTSTETSPLSWQRLVAPLLDCCSRRRHRVTEINSPRRPTCHCPLPQEPSSSSNTTSTMLAVKSPPSLSLSVSFSPHPCQSSPSSGLYDESSSANSFSAGLEEASSECMYNPALIADGLYDLIPWINCQGVPLDVCLAFATPESSDACSLLHDLSNIATKLRKEKHDATRHQLKSSLLNSLRPSSATDEKLLRRALQPRLSRKRHEKQLLRRCLLRRYIPSSFESPEATVFVEEGLEPLTFQSINESDLDECLNNNVIEFCCLQSSELDGRHLSNNNDDDHNNDLFSEETDCPPPSPLIEGYSIGVDDSIDPSNSNSMHRSSYDTNDDDGAFSHAPNDHDNTSHHDRCMSDMQTPISTSISCEQPEAIESRRRRSSPFLLLPPLLLPDTNASCRDPSSLVLPSPIEFPEHRNNIRASISIESFVSIPDKLNDTPNHQQHESPSLLPLYEAPKWTKGIESAPSKMCKSRDFFRKKYQTGMSPEGHTEEPACQRMRSISTKESMSPELLGVRQQSSCHDTAVPPSQTSESSTELNNQQRFTAQIDYHGQHSCVSGGSEAIEDVRSSFERAINNVSFSSEISSPEVSNYTNASLRSSVIATNYEPTTGCVSPRNSNHEISTTTTSLSPAPMFQSCLRRLADPDPNDGDGSLTASVVRFFKRSKRFYHAATSLRNIQSAPGLDTYSQEGSYQNNPLPFSSSTDHCNGPIPSCPSAFSSPSTSWASSPPMRLSGFFTNNDGPNEIYDQEVRRPCTAVTFPSFSSFAESDGVSERTRDTCDEGRHTTTLKGSMWKRSRPAVEVVESFSPHRSTLEELSDIHEQGSSSDSLATEGTEEGIPEPSDGRRCRFDLYSNNGPAKGMRSRSCSSNSSNRRILKTPKTCIKRQITRIRSKSIHGSSPRRTPSTSSSRSCRSENGEELTVNQTEKQHQREPPLVPDNVYKDLSHLVNNKRQWSQPFLRRVHEELNIRSLKTLRQPCNLQCSNLHLHGGGFLRSSYCKEHSGGGEDAFFVSCQDTYNQAIGVADGVSEWTTFGVEGAKFPRELMEHCEKLTEEGLESLRWQEKNLRNRAHGLLATAMDRTTSIGGSTLCVACLNQEGTALEFANIGDSSLAVFKRDSRSGRFRLFFKSKEQQHCSNVPYQLSRLPQLDETPQLEQSGLHALAEIVRRCHQQGFTGDSPSTDASTGRIPLIEGSLILIATDGFWDNLHIEEIEELVSVSISPCEAKTTSTETLHGSTPPILPTCPKILSRLLVDAAFERSKRPPTRSSTPFDKTPSLRGGKADDIALVVSWVISSSS